MSSTEDGLGGELHRLFNDERLSLQPKAGAEEAIIAGTLRVRRRRKIAIAGAGACAVAVILAGGAVFAVQPADQQQLPPLAEPGYTAQEPAQPPAGIPPETSSEPSSSSQPSQTTQAPDSSDAPSDTPTSSAESESPSSTTRHGTVLASATIGPDGYGSLRLGMTVDEASAQGTTMRGLKMAGSCQTYQFSGGGVPGPGSAKATSSGKITSISPSSPAKTPEGVGKGSTKDDVSAAYGNVSGSGSSVTASAGSGVSYVFSFSNDEVSSVSLQSGGGC